MTPPWLRNILFLLRKRRWPSARRRAIWRARWAFERALRAIGPGDFVIDCGANVGDYTAMLAATGATVRAFECDPWCVERLRARFAGVANVEITPKAVGASSGRAALFRVEGFDADPEKASKSSTLFRDKRDAAEVATTTVEQVDLADLIADGPPVALLKLDVEGAEVDVLERLLDSGAIARVGMVFAETHEDKIPALAPRMAALRARIAAQGLTRINLDWA